VFVHRLGRVREYLAVKPATIAREAISNLSFEEAAHAGGPPKLRGRDFHQGCWKRDKTI